MHILNNLKLLLVNCRAMALYEYLIIIHIVIISRSSYTLAIGSTNKYYLINIYKYMNNAQWIQYDVINMSEKCKLFLTTKLNLVDIYMHSATISPYPLYLLLLINGNHLI